MTVIELRPRKAPDDEAINPAFVKWCESIAQMAAKGHIRALIYASVGPDRELGWASAGYCHPGDAIAAITIAHNAIVNREMSE